MYITKKKFGNRVYYYIVENKIQNGMPTMKHVLYLGSVERILEIFRKERKSKG